VARPLEILADTSGIIALLDHDDRYHTAVVEAIRGNIVIVPSTTLPEIDYLVNKYLGEAVVRSFLADLTAGNYRYLAVELEDIEQALQIMARYQGVPLGLVDSSIIALAERYQIPQILTLDRRHFSLIQPDRLEYLTLLPT
jgi:uncharacterized protein